MCCDGHVKVMPTATVFSFHTVCFAAYKNVFASLNCEWVWTIIKAILSFCGVQQSDALWERFLFSLRLGLIRCSSSSVTPVGSCSPISDNALLGTMLFEWFSVRRIDWLQLTLSFSSKNICK